MKKAPITLLYLANIVLLLVILACLKANNDALAAILSIPATLVLINSILLEAYNSHVNK